MLGETFKELSIAPEVHETAWAGDPAVASVSDMARYVAEADADALELKPGKRASVIRFRGMTEREVYRVQRASREDGGGDTQFVEACRYGLVSIEEVSLPRAKVGGLLGLTDAALDTLFTATADLPITALMNVHARAVGVAPVAEPPKDLGPIGLALFIGVHVWRLTFFRLRGR
jgi:hypothetical protein